MSAKKCKKPFLEIVSEAIDDWSVDHHMSFLREVVPLFRLYDIDNENDWLEDEVGKENTQNVRLCLTVYMVSRIAEFQSGRLLTFKTKYPSLYKKMQEYVDQLPEYDKPKQLPEEKDRYFAVFNDTVEVELTKKKFMELENSLGFFSKIEGEPATQDFTYDKDGLRVRGYTKKYNMEIPISGMCLHGR